MQITRDEFMELWRDDIVDILTVDDMIEIFLTSLPGQSDITLPLLKGLCWDYGTSLAEVIKEEFHEIHKS